MLSFISVSQSNCSITVNLLYYALCLMPVCAQLIWLLHYDMESNTVALCSPTFLLVQAFLSISAEHCWQTEDLDIHTNMPGHCDNLSEGWKGCTKGVVTRRDVGCVILLRKTLFKRGHSSVIEALCNDGCAGHRLNSAHLKQFLTTSVCPSSAVSFDDPFFKLKLEAGPILFAQITLNLIFLTQQFVSWFMELINVQISVEVRPLKIIT